MFTHLKRSKPVQRSAKSRKSQSLDNAELTPNPESPHPLSAANILNLQHTIGNRAVQRLLQARQPVLAKPTIARTTPKIQRRIPDTGEIATLLDDETAEIATANMDGLKTALRRFRRNLPQQWQAALDLKVVAQYPFDTAQSIIQGNNKDKLKTLAQIIITAFSNAGIKSAIVHPGLDQPFVPSKSAALRNACHEVWKTLVEVHKGTHDQHLRAVFGDDPAHGWTEAKKRFKPTADLLYIFFQSNKIGADRSGEDKQLGYSGLTTAGQRILLSANVIDQPDLPESFITIFHESFHAAFAAITDAGGYKHEAGFAKKSAALKYNNASHYEEIARRIKNTAPVGGNFVPDAPAQGGAAAAQQDGLNRYQRAQNAATDALRFAWIRGINLFLFFKYIAEQQNNPQFMPSAAQDKTLKYDSTIIDATYHKRIAANPFVQLNTLDLNLAEGVTSDLRKVGPKIPQVAPKSDFDLAWEGRQDLDADDKQDELRDFIIKKALTAVGDITTSTDRDAAMVGHLAHPAFDPMAIQADPPVMPA